MKKLIRECRMGPPKAFKSGAVLGTYPTPLLDCQFDRGGYDILPPVGYVPKNGEVKLLHNIADVTVLGPGSGGTVVNPPSKITVIDYTLAMPTDLGLDFNPPKSSLALESFVADYNKLTALVREKKPFPWKTIVFDSMSGYQDVALNHISSFNAAALSDARQWAAQVGGKVRQLILSATSFPCNVVFIFHTAPPEADDQTKVLQELPNIYSKLKGVVGGLFSQYFYACKDGSKPVIRQADFMYVKGLGSRWPQGLPDKLEPDFKSIYGNEALE